MMDELIGRFTEQLSEALEIGENANLHTHTSKINKVYVAGLGGSGIGADFVAGFIKSESKIPFNVGKGYDIPAHVDENTLAIVSSYSGNTEETLSAFSLLLKTGAKIVCISSGGKLIEESKTRGLDYIKIPDTWPSPRACLGYSLVQQLYVLFKLNIISKQNIDYIRSSISLLKQEEGEMKDIARKVATQIHGKLAVIYTTDRMPAVAVRLRQQLNENAKVLCWHHVIPEMNHNELVGWRDKNEDLAVIYFRNSDDLERNSVRIDINQDIIKKYTPNIINLYSKGDNLIEKSLYFVHLGDWISWYLSDLRSVDSIEVRVIDYLKSELGKV